jgi:aromatic ring-cleaving dioxygenase
MGKILTVNLDADTANYIIKLAKQSGITPSELIRERIYQHFQIPHVRMSSFLPKENYAVKDRTIFRVYLSDQVYSAVINYLRKNKKSIASFIRELFAVVINV